MTETGGYEGCVGGERCHWTQRIVAADDGDGCGDEGSLAERNGEVDAPVGDSDVLSKETRAGVLFDSEEAVEGKQTCTPIASVGEGSQVEVGADGGQSRESDSLGRLVEVGVAMPVSQAGSNPVVERTAW